MILKTDNSVYEVDTDAKRFRRVGDSNGDATLTLGRWQRFDFMTPVEPGHPVRFSWLADDRGRVARIGFVETSPLTSVA